MQPQSVSATALTSVAFIVDPSGLSVGLIRKRLCPCDALKTSASGAEPQWRMPEHQDNPGCPRGWDIVPPPHSATSPPDRLHSVTNPFLAQVQSAVSSQQAAGSRQQAAGSRQQAAGRAEQSRARARARARRSMFSSKTDSAPDLYRTLRIPDNLPQ